MTWNINAMLMQSHAYLIHGLEAVFFSITFKSIYLASVAATKLIQIWQTYF